MGKKNPFIFTIGFDKSDPDHVYVTELLNTTEKKAKLIVAAILAYTGRTDETGNGSISMEPDTECSGCYQCISQGIKKQEGYTCLWQCTLLFFVSEWE